MKRRPGRFEVPDWLAIGYVLVGAIFVLDILMWLWKK